MADKFKSLDKYKLAEILNEPYIVQEYFNYTNSLLEKGMTKKIRYKKRFDKSLHKVIADEVLHQIISSLKIVFYEEGESSYNFIKTYLVFARDCVVVSYVDELFFTITNKNNKISFSFIEGHIEYIDEKNHDEIQNFFSYIDNNDILEIKVEFRIPLENRVSHINKDLGLNQLKNLMIIHFYTALEKILVDIFEYILSSSTDEILKNKAAKTFIEKLGITLVIMGIEDVKNLEKYSAPTKELRKRIKLFHTKLEDFFEVPEYHFQADPQDILKINDLVLYARVISLYSPEIINSKSRFRKIFNEVLDHREFIKNINLTPSDK